MKIRLLTTALLLSLLGAAPIIRAADDAPAQNEDKTDLEKQMDIINKSSKALRKQISDSSQNDSSIALVAKIHDAADAASKLTPKKAADLEGADKDKFMADFQDGMKEFIDHVDQLTAALKAGNNDDAAKIFKGLFDLEKKDHKKFKKAEKKE